MATCCQAPVAAMRVSALLTLLVTSAAADVIARYDEAAGRAVISIQTGSETVSVESVTVLGLTNIPHICESGGPEEDCFQLHTSTTPVDGSESAGVCYKFYTSTDVPGIIVGVCIPHNGSHLFGGAEQYHQLWPIESHVYDFYPYVASRQDNTAVAERYWLFSDGRYVHAEADVPLFVNQNVGDSLGWLCLEAQKQAPYSMERATVVLNKTTCVFPDARQAHRDAVQRFLGKPAGVPDRRVVTHPIWSTWARHGNRVDDAGVRRLAAEIVTNGFNASQLLIDDGWESCYGSLAFDTAKFPDVRKLTQDLHDLGFQVSLWVHPFVNLDCQPYHSEALASGYFVTSTDGSPNTTWWNGEASVVDFTNPDAAAWWSAKLWALLEATGADALSFAAGEPSLLPQPPRLARAPAALSPAAFTRAYVAVAARFGGAAQVGVAARSQALPLLLRMRAKDSGWGLAGGLGSLVTTLLQLNVAGYPLVLPDVVGGGGRGAPSKELFVRWLQAAVFMPAIQFSYLPWDFDDETVELSRRLTALHARHAPLVARLMERAAADGSPVNPPVWWVDPTDQTALTVSSEFLLGEDVLVAPVLEQAAASRDVYLPRGSWRDEADPDHPVLQGPRWLVGYPAPLGVLPYFTRASASDIPDPPAKGGSSQVGLFTPVTTSTSVTSTVLLYICSLILRHFLT